MSISPPTTTTTAAAAATGTNSTTLHHQTYWCHECDMSVLLLQPLYSNSTTTDSSTFPPICPHCRQDFLEQMDSPPPNPSNPTPNPPTFFEPFSPIDPSNPSDDTFLLESPYLHRLIHHLMTTTNNLPSQTNPTPNPTPIPPHYNSPASKQAIESLTHMVIDSAFLDLDPSIVCPVCKDQFVVSSEAKIMPCKHTYHADCIVPWLEMNNSCPVCRFRLPNVSDERNKNEVVQGRAREGELERESFIGAARLDELLDDEQDLFGFTNTLRNVVRRQWYNNGNDDEELNSVGPNWNSRVQWDNEVLLSPTQIGQVEGAGVGGGGGDVVVGDHVERANSVETVSSWLRWPVEGGASGSGSADGEIGVGMSSAEGVIKGDTVNS